MEVATAAAAVVVHHRQARHLKWSSTCQPNRHGGKLAQRQQVQSCKAAVTMLQQQAAAQPINNVCSMRVRWLVSGSLQCWCALRAFKAQLVHGDTSILPQHCASKLTKLEYSRFQSQPLVLALGVASSRYLQTDSCGAAAAGASARASLLKWLPATQWALAAK